jgi:hypothetical protein
MYECEDCNKIFDTKQHLKQHQMRKNKCNIVSPYQCKLCNKYFKYKKNLNEHHDNNCNADNKIVISSSDKVEIAIKSILLSSIDIDSKIVLFRKHNISEDDNTIKLIINSDMDINGKVINLLSFTKPRSTNANINNGTINTNTKTENSHNVTNNIQINSFGKEDISYLDNEYFKNLIMNQHIEKGYVQLIKDIYLNKEHPENGTVKVENINNKYAHIYRNDKWDVILKADLKEQIHKKNYTVLKMHYDKLRKSMSLPKREETRTFLDRDDSGDPHMMYVIDKIILLFYNGEYEEVLEKDKINKNI